MKNRVRAASLVILILMLAVFSLSVTAEGAASADLRYGRGNETDAVLTADALFTRLFPEELPLTAAETAFLREHDEWSLRYRSEIPDSVVDTAYDGSAGTLTVTVLPHRYTAENGETVVWIPQTVVMDDGEPVTLKPVGDAYSAVFGEMWYSEEFELTVTFAWRVELPAMVTDAFFGAHAVAERTLGELRAYETFKVTYDEQKNAYEVYLAQKSAYEQRKSAYEVYLSVKAVYDEKKAAYDAYIAEKKDYDERVAAYDENSAKRKAYEKALTAYYAYEAKRQENAALYDRYIAYQTTMQSIEERLGIMESMFVADSNGWQFYGSLTGGTVDSVVEKRSELKSLGVSGKLINDAKAATDALRELLGGYAAIRNASYPTGFEKTAALFEYYCVNYTELRTQTAKLFDNIYAIYSHGMVQSTMENHPEIKSRVPHFRQFLAQMYVLKSCLNDIETLDLSWTLPLDSEPLSDIVEESLLLHDVNRADPAGITTPTEAVEMDETLFPEPVEKPTKDYVEMTDPRLAGEPEAVKDPGEAPAPVAEPGDAPTPVDPPAAEPTAPMLTDAERALASELEKGSLPERTAKGTSETLTLIRRVNAERSVKNLKTVTFYDADGEALETRYVEYGDGISDPPAISVPEDGAYTYTFLGWVRFGSDDEEPIRLTDIRENLSLAPLFAKRAKTYAVTWLVGGRTTVEFYGYGQVPVCPVDTARASTASTVYTFVGWDREILPVTATATYTAQYETSPATYQILWDLGDRTVSVWLPYGATPDFQGTPTRAADDCIYEFRAWDHAVMRVTGTETYRAEWRVTPLGVDAGGATVSAEHTDDSVILSMQGETVDIAAASVYARDEGKTLRLRRGELEISLTPAELEQLSSAFCTGVELSVEPADSEEGTFFRIRCSNSLGRELTTGMLFTVTVRYPAAEGLYPVAYRIGEANGKELRTELALARYAGGRATFTAREGERILCRPEYLLQYTDESDLCNPTLLAAYAEKGAEISLETDCAYGYEVSGATLVYADGRREEVGATFLMPAERVQVLLHVTQITYHITFVANGKIISEQDLFFGDEVEIPADPERSDDQSYRYLFTGWSPVVTRATGTRRNQTYTATFSKTPLSAGEIRVHTWGFFRTPLFFGLVAGTVALITGTVLFLFRKKIFRKNKSRTAAPPKEEPKA